MGSTASPSSEAASAKRMVLLEAVHVLAASQMAEEAGAGEDVLTAIAALRDAPPLEHWHRGLMIGLRSPDPAVVQATVDATVERLERLDEAEKQDLLMSAILDACFLNLSGRPRTAAANPEALREARRADAHERAGGRLIEAIAGLLRERPLALEHHRSRLLSRARFLEHLAGRGYLARAVVDFQHALTGSERSDSQVATELLRHRKYHLYTSETTTESTLLEYLDHDQRLPLAEVSEELFQVYRMLLHCQTKERARRAILRTLDNLRHWLDQIPREVGGRSQLQEDVERARVLVPWQELDVRVCRHLEAHLELLPGAEHPEDLLLQLRERYDAAESEDILISGLGLLERLPLVRLRSTELCDFILRPGMHRRSAAVWQAFLELIGALVTGLADFVLTREALERQQARLNLLRRSLLEHDGRLRALLHRLATDDGLRLSSDAAVERQVRETAWRILLRSLPQDRTRLYEEGLVRHGGRLFFATLEEGSHSQRRELWPLVHAHWDELLASSTAAEERRTRLLALTAVFRRTRDFDAVQDDGGELGPILGLVFDEEDDEVRRAAEEAVIEAGYQLELARERQRRELLASRDQLTASNRRVVEYETEVGRLAQELTAAQTRRAEHSLEVQELLQHRDVHITDGWLSTANLQVDLEEVRAELAAALDRAQQQLRLLRGLQQRMQEELARCRQIHDAIDNLVHQEDHQERLIEQLGVERQRASGRLAQVASELDSARRELSHLQASPPARPIDYGDEDRNRQEEAAYRNRYNRWQGEIAALRRGIASLEGENATCEQTIASCERRIRAARAELRRLRQQIEATQQRLQAVRQQVTVLGQEFGRQQATCQAIRQEIHRLQGEVSRLADRLDVQRREIREQVDHNTASIGQQQEELDGLQQQLRSLSDDLNRTGDALDRQRTNSQRLIQAIDSGRHNYDQVAEAAIPQSARADAIGHSLEARHEQEVLETQEALVHYVEGLHRAVRDEPSPPTREQRRSARTPRQTTNRR